MYHWRKYRCACCNETFPINDKLLISDEISSFYCPLCMEAIQEPLVLPKPVDKCAKMRIIFFILLIIHGLMGVLGTSITIYNNHLDFEFLRDLVFIVFLCLGLLLFYCSKRNAPIIDTERIEI